MQMKQALIYFVFKCELEIFDDSLIDWPTPPKRIHKLCTDPQLTPALTIDCAAIAPKIVAQIYPGVTTVELDELAAHLCSSLNTTHP